MNRPVLVALSALLGLATACSDQPVHGTKPPAPSSSVGVGGGATGGAGGECGTGGTPIVGPIQIGATDGTLALPFAVKLVGTGTKRIGAIDIDADTGTVEIGGESLAAVSYEQQPFGQYVLYQTLAVAQDRLYAIWFYCDAGQLAFVYFEGTDGTAIDVETASGTCAAVDNPIMANVKLPAIDMPLPEFLTGYTIEGPLVHLPSGAPGSVDFGGGSLAILAFDKVDCTACGNGGWQEVHTLLWDVAAKRLCFAIFYLFAPGDPVTVSYSLTLPDLTDPANDAQLEATFTTP